MRKPILDLVVLSDHGLLAHLIQDPPSSQGSHLSIQMIFHLMIQKLWYFITKYKYLLYISPYENHTSY